MLKSLFVEVTQPSTTEPPKVTRKALIDVCERHKTSDTRRDIYRRINTKFPTTSQDPSSVPNVFSPLLLQSLGFDVSPPDSGSTGAVLSFPSPGVASSSRIPPDTQVAPPPPTNSVTPSKSVEDPAPEPSPNLWSCLFGCLTRPS